MATEAQVQANRLNAQKSTGPRTEEGKEKASQNALKHGLLAREGVIRGESRAEYEIHREMLLEELEPAGVLEGILASRVVDLTWRLHRAGQDRNEAFGALYDRYIARRGSAGAACVHGAGGDAHPTGEAAGVPVLDGEPEVWDTGTAAERGITLGRMILEDFEQEAVLDRLLRYERRIEGSLYRTLNELRRLRAESRKADREAAETVARWREEDWQARKARAFAFEAPAGGPPGAAEGTTNTPRAEVAPASEVPSSPFTDPVPDSPQESETCETNPIPERASSWKCQVAGGSCKTNPISGMRGEGVEAQRGLHGPGVQNKANSPVKQAGSPSAGPAGNAMPLGT